MFITPLICQCYSSLYDNKIKQMHKHIHTHIPEQLDVHGEMSLKNKLYPLFRVKRSDKDVYGTSVPNIF